MKEETKKCTQCENVKPVSGFYKEPRVKSGLSAMCKECKDRQVKYWEKTNKERVRRNEREWYAKNKEKINKRKRKWCAENPEKKKESGRKWKNANKEKARQYNHEWWAKNPEKMTIYRQKRRGRENNADGSHTIQDVRNIFDSQGGQCNACGKKLIRYNKKQYHVDHIVSLSKGGTNWPDNLQLLCPTCNLSKKNKKPDEWARENGRLF